jgi:Zn-dependent protease
MPRREILALSVAWVVLGVSFSMKYMFERAWWSTPVALAEVILLTLFIIGTGFLGHELAHKFVAQRYGAWAEFKLWTVGAIMSLVFAAVSAGSFIFAAPGAVYIASRSSYIGDVMDKKTNGIISLVGPVVNVAAASIAGLLYVGLSAVGIGVILDGFNPLTWAIKINLWLGAFNMIPFFILDGQKVLTWNKTVWGLITIPLWAATALSILLLP